MKKIVCELCDSMDLVKDGDLFVCQGCGAKYTVEQAKAMMKEVEGDAATVTTAASAADNEQKIASLLTLARSSFDSKNYAQAEEFCNQIIALDDKHHEAWKLKGEAINYQITAKNQRILEVYNCLMTAYRVLSDEDKQKKMFSILNALKVCMEGEVEFWVEQFEANRPTNAALTRTKNAFTDARRKMGTAFDEFGIPGAKEDYFVDFDNMFIRKCNLVCASAWRTTVGYNYYRDYLSVCDTDPFTRSDKEQKWIIKDTDLWRPMKKTWDTFLEEADNLISLLKFAEDHFNHETSADVMAVTYSWIAYIQERVIPSGSWKITQGYTSTWDEYKSVGWHEEYGLTEAAQNVRKTEANAYRYRQKKAPEKAEELKRKKEAKDRRARIKAYWDAHPQEKEALEAKKAELTEKKAPIEEKIAEIEEQIKALKDERDAKTASELAIDELRDKIRSLALQRSNLGIFAGKEKKRLDAETEALRAQIPAHQSKVEGEKKERADEFEVKVAPLNEQKGKLIAELEAISKELDGVVEELTKDRT